jgi:hypothetical protein
MGEAPGDCGVTWASFRASDKVYRNRPPANCRAARAAWDHHAKDGPVVWLRLLDEYWGAERPNGDIDEVDAASILEDIS